MTREEVDALLPVVAREVEPHQDKRSRDSARDLANHAEEQLALEWYLDDAAELGVKLSSAVLADVRRFVAEPPIPFNLDMHDVLARLEAA